MRRALVLSDAEARILEVLTEAYTPLRVAEIADFTGYTRRYASRALRTLHVARRVIEVGHGQWVAS